MCIRDRHYAAACGTDVRLTADLAAAAAEGYTALHDALHGVTFAALGRKKKTDLFDEDIDVYKRQVVGIGKFARFVRHGCGCADSHRERQDQRCDER